jgi:hypothetical protein
MSGSLSEIQLDSRTFYSYSMPHDLSWEPEQGPPASAVRGSYFWMIFPPPLYISGDPWRSFLLMKSNLKVRFNPY